MIVFILFFLLCKVLESYTYRIPKPVYNCDAISVPLIDIKSEDPIPNVDLEFSSGDYWEDRYQQGQTSGSGSIGIKTN